MKFTIQSRTKWIIVVVSLLIVALVAAFFVSATLNKRSDTVPNGDDSPAVIDDDASKPDEQNPLDNDPTSLPSEDVPPASNPPKTDGVCDDDIIVGGSFRLVLPAYVYITALDARDKTNPVLTYEPGEYRIFKCYDGMANITRTQGVAGGWIDPANPYQAPTTPAQIPDIIPYPTPPPIDVMILDNTTVNWSHEYPTAFVRDYNGF